VTPHHHPFPETLVSYAAGTLPGAISGVVACHLSACAQCADDVRLLELVGGLMLERLQAVPGDMAQAERLIAQWSGETISGELDSEPQANAEDPLLPMPLARYLGPDGLGEWTVNAAGAQHCAILLPEGSGRMRLRRLEPGERLLDHDGSGETGLALVLHGLCTDDRGEYRRGDVIEWAGDGIRDLRSGGDEECICLIASDAAPALPARRLHKPPRPINLPNYSPALRVRNFWDWRLALAAGIAVVIGIGCGWLLRGSPESEGVELDSLVETEGDHLIARGFLQNALDGLPSGRQLVEGEDKSEFRLAMQMTFQDQDGDYCRQYYCQQSQGTAGSEHYAGIACRKDNKWVVKLQTLVPPPRPEVQQMIASRETADVSTNAVVRALISGNPLAGQAEAAVMGKGWSR
jgi:putative transcriptional regulator